MSGKDFSKELSRELNLFHITMMGLGMMIGAGVFLGVGNAIAEVGPGGVLLTFALNGVIALLTAMSYAELSSAIPRAGGAYNFARLAFGRGTSFIAGWMEWFASSVAGAMYALTFSIYTLRYLKELGFFPVPDQYMGLSVKICAAIIALFFLYINYRGASETGKIGAIFTLGQTLFLVGIGLAGVYVIMTDPERIMNFTPFLPRGWGKLLVTMGFTYVAFEGYEVIAQAGDETIDPKKNLPKAMIYSVCIVTLIYILVAFACIVAIKRGMPGIDMEPWQWIGQFRELGFGESISRLIPYGSFFLTLAVIFASTSALNATVYSAARAGYALGRDKMLPGLFAKISPTRKTPSMAIVFTGVIILFTALFLPTMDVASSASIMFLSLFFLINICVIKIRRNMADELVYGYIMPLFPFVPIAAIIIQGILAVWLVHMSLVAWIVAPVWILSGVFIFNFYSKSRAVVTEDEIQILEEEKEDEQIHGKSHVMIPVANPKNAIELVKSSQVLCRDEDTTFEILHMVEVPPQTPLRDADKYMMEGREGIVEAMLYLAPIFPVNTTIRYCRNIARGIRSAIREKKVELLVIGWANRKRHQSMFRMGSTIDPLLENSPCDIAIMRTSNSDRPYNKVLVPVSGGPNSALAL
ncbi:MAG: amino acid permease, partial [Candidatus Muiribacteriaceae bacterium]